MATMAAETGLVERGADVVAIDARQDLVMRRSPGAVLAEAQQAARELVEVLKQKKDPVMINGQQYLEYEDWQVVATFYGVTAKVTGTTYAEYGGAHGFEARAVAVRRADGVEISAAESMCLDDEERWADRELFQLKSMAQTRACSKALRNVFAWVVGLGGYGTTPAEELDGVRPRERKAAPAAAQPKAADGSVLVVEVKESHSKPGAAKAWTKWEVSFDDGTYGSTFDAPLAQAARDAKASGRRMVPTLVQDGRYTNLTALAAVIPGTATPGGPPVAQEGVIATDEAPHGPDAEPVGGPEKVLAIRAAKTPAGVPFWRIQTSAREYVTDVKGVAELAEQLRVKGEPAYVAFTTGQGKRGPYNQVTEFGASAAAVATEEP